MKDRKIELLRAAYDMLKRAEEMGYVVSPLEILTRYDEADCYGSCLMEDIRDELGLEHDTPPIPLEEQD